MKTDKEIMNRAYLNCVKDAPKNSTLHFNEPVILEALRLKEEEMKLLIYNALSEYSREVQS